MSLFGKGYAAEAEKPQDFQKRTLDTGIYEGVVRMAFAGQSSGGAASITLELALDNGKTYKETMYVSNKKGENTYVDKNDKVQYLPGFLTANQLALFATGKDLFELEPDIETRTIKLYDFNAQKELPTDVPCLVPLLDQRVLVVIEEYEDEKKSKQGNEYIPTGEIQLKNQIIKVLQPGTRLTAVEVDEGKTEPAYANDRESKAGVVRKLKGKTESANTQVASKPTPSGLFGQKK